MTPPGSTDALLVRGVVLPEGEPRDLYLIDGRVSLTPVGDARLVAEGWIVPGLIDAHCHVGLDAQGGVDDRAEQERQRGSAPHAARHGPLRWGAPAAAPRPDDGGAGATEPAPAGR